MTAPRIPSEWMHLRPGEQVHSRLPFHRLKLIAGIMKLRGVTVTLTASNNGYFVACTHRKKDAA